MTRRPAIACLLGIALVAIACGLKPEWTTEYKPAPWHQAELKGLTSTPDGSLLAFGTLATYTSDAPNGGGDIFLAQFDSSGRLQWERNYDIDGHDGALWMKTGPDGSIYFWLLADSGNQTIKLSPSGDIQWQIESGFFDLAFASDRVCLAHGRIACYDNDGALLWEIAGQFGAREIEIDSAGNLFAAGTHPEAGSTGDDPDTDAWLAKVSPTGEMLWETMDGAPGWDEHVGGLAVTAAGNPVVAAEVELTGDYSGVVTRMYDANGATLWTDEYANRSAFDNFPEEVIVDRDGNILVLSQSVRLSRSALEATNDERVVTKLSRSGAVLWRKVEAGFKFFNRGLLRNRIYVDAGGDVYATGFHATHVYDRNGKELTTIEDETYYNNFIAFGTGAAVYLGTTSGPAGNQTVRLERYDR